MDTIFALSSGTLPAGIAVVRISGPDAFGAAQALAGSLPEPRRAAVRALRDADGTLLDRGLVLCFPGPATATGEDLCELHLHGGRAVVRAVEAALARRPRLRQAEAGEFTRRALMNGRIDLSEAEGLGDLLAAETEAQRRVALRAAEGGIRHEVEQWTAAALAISAAVEAVLDHGDEADVVDIGGDDPLPGLRARSAELAGTIATVVARPPVERLRDGFRVVLAGPPNAGKSTLLNALAGREAAIVSPLAGTTRDRIEVPVSRGTFAFVFIDTAGLHDAPSDAVEAIGIDRAHDAVASADLVLWLGDEAPPEHPCLVRVYPRADLPDRSHRPSGDAVRVSAATGAGVDTLWDEIERRVAPLAPPPDLPALNQRQRVLAAQAAEALARAAQLTDPLLFAEEVRAALRSFDAITGRAGVEAMLDALFSRFCIGK